jgi:hypothetical protein
METISNILASFDIFQVIIDAVPLITDPIVQAFEQIFITLYAYAKNLFTSHPGLALGLIVFVTGYAGVNILKLFRRTFSSSLHPLKQRSL